MLALPSCLPVLLPGPPLWVHGSVKRSRKSSEGSDFTHQVADDELCQGAEVLRALKLGRWEWRGNALDARPRLHSLGLSAQAGCCSGASLDDEAYSSTSSTACDTAFSSSSQCPSQAHEGLKRCPQLPRYASVNSRVSAATRSYIWRGPGRRASTPPAADPHGTGEGGADYQGSSPTVPSSKADCDKEWAALTTWIRMNLHQPRTAKRVVLFTGEWDGSLQRWVFQLNEELTWDDVGPETKLRLRTLPEETAAAFARKYPTKQRSEWQDKTQKYRLASGHTVPVPLGDMIWSLQHVYMQYESTACAQQASPGQNTQADVSR